MDERFEVYGEIVPDRLPVLLVPRAWWAGVFGAIMHSFQPRLTSMHRLSSKRAVLNLRMAAVCLFAFIGLVTAVLVLLVVSFVTSDRMMSVYALWTGVIGALVYAFYVLFSGGVRCPLCHVRLISKNFCSINRRAKKALGSHRLRVAFGVLFLNSFRCPYCGEATEVRARDRRGASRRHRSS